MVYTVVYSPRGKENMVQKSVKNPFFLDQTGGKGGYQYVNNVNNTCVYCLNNKVHSDDSGKR